MSYIPETSSLHLQKYFMSYIFMIKKDSCFCDQILQAVAILDKKLKIFIFIFVKGFFYFFAFPTIPNLLHSFKYSKSYRGSKN